MFGQNILWIIRKYLFIKVCILFRCFPMFPLCTVRQSSLRWFAIISVLLLWWYFLHFISHPHIDRNMYIHTVANKNMKSFFIKIIYFDIFLMSKYFLAITAISRSKSLEESIFILEHFIGIILIIFSKQEYGWKHSKIKL